MKDQTVNSAITHFLTGSLFSLLPMIGGMSASSEVMANEKSSSHTLENTTQSVADDNKTISHTHKEKVDEKNLAKITINGANDELKENLLALLPSRRPACQAKKRLVEKYLTSAERYLQKAARGLGYYDSEFQVNSHQKDQCWVFDIQVKQGRPVNVGRVDVQLKGEGRNNEAFQKITAEPMYKTGDLLKQSKYSSYKSSLQSAATSLGYFDAEFAVHKIEVNLDNYTANIQLHFDTGKRYRLGKIDVEQTVLNDSHLQRYIQLKQGDFYSSESLSKQQLYLQTTGYYADVVINSDVKAAKNYQVPLTLKLISQKRNVYTYSVGYGTDTGFRASANMERRWVNKRGHKLEAEVLASEKYSIIGAKYTVPLHHPQNEYVAYFMNFENLEGDDIKSMSAEIGAEYTHKARNGVQQTLTARYLYDITEIPSEEDLESNYLLIGGKLEKVKRDDPVFPTKGYKVSLNVEGAHSNLLSKQNVWLAHLDMKYLKKLGSGQLISRASLGHVAAENFNDLPQSLRFFAGGRNTIRGYDFESLGDINEQGINIGAKNLIATSLEYNHPIKDKWSVAAFVDAGNAFNSWQEDTLLYGFGGGARWKSPVGNVKVDIAWPSDNLGDPHLHLSIGPEL
ncbi:MAG: autotransporter assembly complex protein TamA [bacterium]